MKIIYLDCFSGISGDMTLAALVDAGADREYIEQELFSKIKIEPFSLEWKRVNKRGISALKMDVLIDPGHPPAHHRHYSDIVDMIVAAGFNERVTSWALAIFEKIGIAEAKIHDVPVEKVHFHEVGAIDSIVDVIGVALALDSLEVEKIVSSPIPLGSGTVHCDHGIYPVPAPATLEMMKGLPVAESRHRMEMTTPTGAGIVSGIVDEFSRTGLPSMIVEAIGYGAGTRELANQPNVLRVIVGTTDPLLAKWHAQHELLPKEHAGEHVHHHRHEHGHGHEHGHSHKHHHHNHSHKHEGEPGDSHHGHVHEHSHDGDEGDHRHGDSSPKH